MINKSSFYNIKSTPYYSKMTIIAAWLKNKQWLFTCYDLRM